MKYYLSVDRGSFYKQDERYTNIIVEKIKAQFSHNNNLKLLCEFTMLFKDMITLKQYLIESKILASNLQYFDIKITYNYKGKNFSLAVPFNSDEKYFHVNFLASILITRKEDFKFLKNFLNRIRFHAGLPEEFYILKRYVNEKYVKDPLDVIIKNFITSICYQKGKLNFRGLYDIAMILSSMTKEPKKDYSILETASNISEEALFEAEELQERLVRKKKDNSDQLSLF